MMGSFYGGTRPVSRAHAKTSWYATMTVLVIFRLMQGWLFDLLLRDEGAEQCSRGSPAEAVGRSD